MTAAAWLLLSRPSSHAEPGVPNLPAWGITVKADAVNRLAAPGLKLWPVPRIQLEGFWFGAFSEYDGYAVRGLFLPWMNHPTGRFRIQPYCGAGYADIRQSIDLGTASITWQIHGQDAGLAAAGDMTAKGAGLQLVGGIQWAPWLRLPRLRLELEAAYTTFDISGRGTIRTEGSGMLERIQTTTDVSVKSEYDALSLILALSFFF